MFLLSQEATEVQWDTLITNFKDPETNALVRENVEVISSGSLPHRAGALKTGLKKAFELKKEKRTLPSVGLRCSNYYCKWHLSYISYSVARPNLYCELCIDLGSGNYYLQCMGCGTYRKGNYALCWNCGKSFK